MIMKENVRNVLVKHGFEIQDTSFFHQLENPNLNQLKLIELGKNPATEILFYYPDFFVFHRTLEPSLACWFILMSEQPLTIIDKEYKVLMTYFPPAIINVFNDKHGELFAKWLHSGDEPQHIDAFIENKLLG